MTAMRKSKAAAKPKRDRGFTDLIRLVPYPSFVYMVRNSGLTPNDSKELCRAFKEFCKS